MENSLVCNVLYIKYSITIVLYCVTWTIMYCVYYIISVSVICITIVCIITLITTDNTGSHGVYSAAILVKLHTQSEPLLTH